MSKKKNKPLFKHYANPAFEYITIDNVEVKVKFFLENKNEIQLSFGYMNDLYACKLVLKDLNRILTVDDIVFNGIDLNHIDRNRLANRLEEFIDYNFNSGY